MRVRFDSTVRTVTCSSAATSLFARPAATSTATRASVSVKALLARGLPPLMRASSERARSAHSGLSVSANVERADAIEARERHQDFAIVRRLPANEPGIAALRHDRR